MDDLDDLLRRVERGGNRLTPRPLLYARDELPDHRECDVRFEQRDADLAAGRVNVGRGQAPPASQRGEDLGQPVG